MLDAHADRRGSISPEFMDTAFPEVPQGDAKLDRFHQTKFKLAELFNATLNHSMRVVTPPYSNVIAVNKQM